MNVDIINEYDKFDEIIIDNSAEYVASGNDINQFNEKTIEQTIRDKFKLEYPNGYPKINDNDLKELFGLLFYTNESDLNEAIKDEFDILNNSQIENSSLDGALTSQNKNANYYSEIENKFLDKNDEVLSSDLLDEIIDGRKELFNSYPNDKLAWLLANSYQMYAFNYLRQTDEARSILYLYMQSIYYARKSIEFDISPEDKIARIRYIQMRYNDIATCNLFDNEIRVRAYNIYCAMSKLNELSVSASYDMNTVQSSSSGIDVMINATTSLPAEHVTITAVSDTKEYEPFDMHGGTCDWYFRANFFEEGNYTITVTAYDFDGAIESDEFTFKY